MNATQREIAETRLAEALGRPEKRCPSCKQIGAHWLADTLDDAGLIVPGRFTCATPVALASSTLLDFKETT